MSVELWIYIEKTDPVTCGIPEAALGLLHKLRSLREGKEITVTAVMNENCDPAPVFSGGAQKIYRLLGRGDERQAAGQIAALCREHKPDIMVFLATITSRNIAAMTAAELETGLSADCTDIALRADGVLVQTRPAFGGLLYADIICEKKRPQLATVRPGIFLPGRELLQEKAGINKKIIDVPESGLEALTSLLSTMNTGLRPLSASRIVLSGGKGIESADGMLLLQKLAALTGAAVGASRGAVSAGFVQYGWQVGLTGQTIRPDVYIAFGISGAVQHLVGMEGAKTVIAVNSDKNAPIFEYADVGIVSDWKRVVMELIILMEEKKKDFLLSSF